MKNIKKISNPLTIIAIFAGLAEVAGTTAIFGLDASLQNTFIWFVMLFPTIIVVLFFGTLNFNPRVLYAPGDYQEDSSFIDIMNSSKTAVDVNLLSLEQKLDDMTKMIDASLPQSQSLLTEINSIKERLLSTKEATDDLTPKKTSERQWLVKPPNHLYSQLFKDINIEQCSDDFNRQIRLMIEALMMLSKKNKDGSIAPSENVLFIRLKQNIKDYQIDLLKKKKNGSIAEHEESILNDIEKLLKTKL